MLDATNTAAAARPARLPDLAAETPQQAARRFSAPMLAKGYKPAALHPYTNADGAITHYRIRLKHQQTGEKWTRPMRMGAEGWELSEPDFPNGKPLYRLHELAAQPGAPCWYVEGENCADALARLGVVATTGGGATSDERADFAPLAGRTVTIWPDHDQPGIEHGERVAAKLRAIGCTVEMIDAAALGLPEKGDCVDWLKAHPGATAAELAKLPRVRATPFLVAAASGQEWPEPLPLPEGLPAVAPFDFALLPDTLRPWAEDICERVQCPPDFVGATIMAALGSVIGRRIGIRPQAQTDWTEVPNQWALIVGRPGVLKSPAMEAALSPLKRLASQAVELHRSAMEEYQRAARLAKLRAEASEKAARAKLAKNPSADVSGDLVGDEAQEPALRRYIANDTTAAALGELLRQNQNGLLVFRDELVSLLKGLDREDNAEARGFYLTGWNGTSGYTFDRIGRGMNLHIEAVCLSLLGSTQPGRIAEYLRAAVKGGAGDDGLIQRFGLLVWPDTGAAWRDVDRWPDSAARRKVNAVFEALNALDPASIGAQQDEFAPVPFLRFDGEALALFREWREAWEAKLRGGDLHPALESHLAKYRKLVPGLALSLHLADGCTGPVGKRPTLQALAWAEYLETHARRAYASVMSPEVTAAKAILVKLRRGELSHTFAARDIYRRGWAQLSEREHVLDALQLLVDLDRLAVHVRDTGGRVATIYEANPRGFAP